MKCSVVVLGLIALAHGAGPLLAGETAGTEPRLEWPVISEEDANKLRAKKAEAPGSPEASVTAPAIEWPVISEAEAIKLKQAGAAQGPGVGEPASVPDITEPGMPWPVVSEKDIAAPVETIKTAGDAEHSVTEPGMPWPVVSEADAQGKRAQALEQEQQQAQQGDAERSVTEPGIPWPVVSEAEADKGPQVTAAAPAPDRSVTEPGMPWPVVREEKPAETRPAQLKEPQTAESKQEPTEAFATCKAGIERALASGPLSFRIAQATVQPASVSTLEAIAAAAKGCTGVRIIIEGHTDALGPEVLNRRLSKARAEAVAAFLEKAGIDRRFIQTEGYGSSRPVASNDSAAERARNRRIAITVVGLSDATQ